MPAEPATPDPPRSTAITVVALTTLAQFGTVMGIAVFAVIATELAAEIGVEPSLIGYQFLLLTAALARRQTAAV